MEELDLMPLRVDRATEPALLGGDVARLLEWVDVGWFRGRIRRAPGEVGTQIQGAATTITNAFVAVRRDCRKVVLDTTGGTVRCTPGNAATLMCLGPTNEWDDLTDMGTRIGETDDEDDGVDESGGCG